ncbi:MAG TPA: aldo/keto reductase [Gemmataceae bacterium]|nr:aldo/keto reductase [Gemmataceae bacterium]
MMRYRILGRTGLRVSALAVGAGPVSGLMTGEDHAAQLSALRKAIELGINWIDTAPGYGQGASERNVGRALAEVGRESLHLATKVRLAPDQLTNVRDAVRQSIEDSLRRLGLPAVTLLQLHNGLTTRREDEPFSITPVDVLGPGGILDAFREFRDAGLVRHLGLTGTGQPSAMREVVRSGGFDTIQVPLHMLNPSAARIMPPAFGDTDYGNIIADCADMKMGVFAIRVFAGGAILGHEPSAHTLKTPFFPLDLYRRDRQRAEQLIAERGSLKETALRFVLDDPRVTSAIIGFGDAGQVEELATIANRLK